MRGEPLARRVHALATPSACLGHAVTHRTCVRPAPSPPTARSYHHLVEHVLGPRAAVTVAGFQATLMVIAAVGIVLAGAEAFSGAAHHLDGVLDAQWERVLVIAVVELALSQAGGLSGW